MGPLGELIRSLGKLVAALGDNAALKQLILDEGIKDPVSGTDDWTDVRQFNLMFQT